MTETASGGRARCVWDADCVLGESPLWNPEDRAVYFVDIRRRMLLRYSPETGDKRTWELPCRVSCITLPGPAFSPPRRQGAIVFLCACDEGFAWLTVDRDGINIEAIVEVRQDHPSNRFNDGKLGPEGAFYAGTMDDEERVMSGALYRLTPQLEVETLERGVGIPNGPAFSPDGSHMYFNDSMLGAMFAYDLADGQLSKKRLLRRYTENGEAPDGMDVDESGNVYTAIWGGSRIDVIDPLGVVVSTISLKTRSPTSVCRPNKQQLFITTARGNESPLCADSSGGGLYAYHLKADRRRATSQDHVEESILPREYATAQIDLTESRLLASDSKTSR